MQRAFRTSGLFSSLRSQGVVVNTPKRFAGGFNSKFNFEKPYDPKRGDNNPFYEYDPTFSNESTVCTCNSFLLSII